MSETTNPIILEAAEKASQKSPPGKAQYNLEALVFLTNKQRVSSLEEKTRTEFKQLRDRQNQVKFLHQTLKAINVATDSKGNFDSTTNPAFENMFNQAREMGVDIAPGKTKYNKDEREALIENIRMTCDDLKLENDMQLQTITRLTNERYESFQLAKTIMKPLHDDKVNKARSLSGK